MCSRRHKLELISNRRTINPPEESYPLVTRLFRYILRILSTFGGILFFTQPEQNAVPNPAPKRARGSQWALVEVAVAPALDQVVVAPALDPVAQRQTPESTPALRRVRFAATLLGALFASTYITNPKLLIKLLINAGSNVIVNLPFDVRTTPVYAVPSGDSVVLGADNSEVFQNIPHLGIGKPPGREFAFDDYMRLPVDQHPLVDCALLERQWHA